MEAVILVSYVGDSTTETIRLLLIYIRDRTDVNVRIPLVGMKGPLDEARTVKGIVDKDNCLLKVLVPL